MNADTANSLLKVLEEPPPYAIFLLTAGSISSVLPTIVSRAQVVRFRHGHAAQIEAVLLEKAGVSPEQARFLAAYVQGEIGTALNLAKQPALMAGRDAILDIAADVSAGAHPIMALKFADEFRKAASKIGPDRAEDGAEDKTARTALVRALDVLSLWYGDVLSLVARRGGATPINSDRRGQLEEIARKYQLGSLEKALALTFDIRRAVERNANAQIAIETMMIHLVDLAATSRDR
jgi:DNA polymerase-3 subunit delta'